MSHKASAAWWLVWKNPEVITGTKDDLIDSINRTQSLLFTSAPRAGGWGAFGSTLLLGQGSWSAKRAIYLTSPTVGALNLAQTLQNYALFYLLYLRLSYIPPVPKKGTLKVFLARTLAIPGTFPCPICLNGRTRRVAHHHPGYRLSILTKGSRSGADFLFASHCSSWLPVCTLMLTCSVSSYRGWIFARRSILPSKSSSGSFNPCCSRRRRWTKRPSCLAWGLGSNPLLF